MKVLIIAYACEPDKGSEAGTAWNIVNRMARDHEVSVVTRANNEEKIVEALENVEGCRPHFYYVDPPSIFLKLKKMGVLSVQLFYVLWQVAVSVELWKQKVIRNFDICHHLTFNSFEVPSMVAYSSSVKKFVWGPIGGGQRVPLRYLHLFGWRNGFLEFLRNIRVRLSAFNPFCILALARADLVYFANQETRQLLARWCRGEVRMMVDVGVDVQKFGQPGVREDAMILRGIPNILFAGIIEPRKGLSFLLRVLNLLKKRGVQFQCHVVGFGSQMKKMNDMICDLSLEDFVVLEGRVPHDRMCDVFKQADVFAFPSLRDTSGTIVMEAMAMEIPTVCFDHQGSALMVNDESGIKVSLADVKTMVCEWADNIEKLLGQPELCREMGGEARSRVIAEYDWVVRVEKTIQGYESIKESVNRQFDR